jgi:hypothetical protein
MRLLSRRRDKEVQLMIDHNIKTVSPETPVTDVLGDLKGGKKVVIMKDEQPTKLLELFDVTPDDVRNRRQVGELASTDIVIKPSSANKNQVYDSLIKEVAVAISGPETVKASSETTKATESSISGIITMSDYSKVRLVNTRDAKEMCNRVMWLLVHELTVHPEVRDFDKDAVWEHSSFINGVHEEFGPGLKVIVFNMLADRGDIEDLGTRIRITDKGAGIPVNRELYALGRSYLNP